MNSFIHSKLEYRIAALAGVVLLSACQSNATTSQSGFAPPMPQVATQVQNAAANPALAPTKFLPAATKGPLSNSPIHYEVPPLRHMVRANITSGGFPTPSQCVALYGWACYTSAMIRKAYNVPSSLTGAGQTIMIIVAYGSPTIQNDLHTFDTAMGLPDPTFNILYPTGPAQTSTAQKDAPQNWAFETTLDVEWSHAIAPEATIDLVVAANFNGDVMNNAEEYAVSHHLGNVMSMSFGLCESGVGGQGHNVQLLKADSIYHEAAEAGITVISGSGNSGAATCVPLSTFFPASDPWVTAVGGTNLFLADDGKYQSETTWNDSNDCPFGCTGGAYGATGGAPSLIFAAPSYQQAFSGNAARTTSDVAYDASAYTAIWDYLSFPNFYGLQPGWYRGGGTSSGVQQWGAIVALADQAAGRGLGFINPKLYAIAANRAEYARATT